ncbi:restriction endonuclease subunit S [Vibrio rumoiensis]|uniref:restriction endonuclease subunit S n=1 Tax=Vibrio rumoiensis TaxID=76258 RepID=UPI003749AF4A
MRFEIATLESLCELVVDCPHSTPKWTDEGIIVLRNQNIKNGVLDLSAPSFTNEEDYLKRIKRADPKEGDIVFTREAPMGEVCMIPEGVKCCLGQRQVLLRPKSDVNGQYLFWALQSPYVQQQIAWNEGTGSTVSNVRIPVLKALNIPRIDNEDMIAKSLSDIASKMALNTQTNQTLEQMAQAIFKSWFVDFDPVKAKMNGKQPEGMDAATASLFPEKLVDTDVGELPDGWKLVPVGELLDKAIGGDWGKEEPDEKHTEEVRIVRGTDIPKLHGGAIDSVPVRYVESKKLKTRKLERGDIVIEVSGGSKDQPTGRTLFISDNILNRLELPSEPASFCRRFKPKSYEIGLLLAVHFQLMYKAGKTWEYQNQSTGISNFQTTYFLEAEHVVVPSEEVLAAFIKQVSPMMDMAHSNQNIELAKLRDTLLPKLISGEIELESVATE